MKVKCEFDVLSFYYPYHKELKKEVLNYLHNYQDKQNKSTNVKATMTEWNFTTPQIEKLKKFVYSNLIFFVSEECIKRAYFSDFWANIYNEGDYTVPHDHLTNCFSFVYFLQSKIYHSPLIFSDSKKRVVPKEGNFLIFSSSIVHEVPKHKHKENRITLAGNINFIRK
jgi:hypothetical protein